MMRPFDSQQPLSMVVSAETKAPSFGLFSYLHQSHRFVIPNI